MAEKKPSVCVLMTYASKEHRVHVSKFVLESGGLPLYPEMVSDFFPGQQGSESQDGMLKRSDEVWFFGPLNRKLFELIVTSKRLGKPVKFFDLADPQAIKEIAEDDVEHEGSFKTE